MADVIKTYLDKRDGGDLVYAETSRNPAAGSNEVELTERIVGDVVSLLLERKPHREIRRAVKMPNPKAGGARTLSLSYGQIKRIERALRERQSAIAAEKVEAEIKPVEVLR